MANAQQTRLAALQQQRADLDEQIRREGSVGQSARDAFAAPARWMSVLAGVYMLIFLVVLIGSAVAFFRSDTVRGMLLSVGLFLSSLVILVALKIWFWLMMLRAAQQRRLRRLELELAQQSLHVVPRSAAGEAVSKNSP